MEDFEMDVNPPADQEVGKENSEPSAEKSEEKSKEAPAEGVKQEPNDDLVPAKRLAAVAREKNELKRQLKELESKMYTPPPVPSPIKEENEAKKLVQDWAKEAYLNLKNEEVRKQQEDQQIVNDWFEDLGVNEEDRTGILKIVKDYGISDLEKARDLYKQLSSSDKKAKVAEKKVKAQTASSQGTVDKLPETKVDTRKLDWYDIIKTAKENMPNKFDD